MFLSRQVFWRPGHNLELYCDRRWPSAHMAFLNLNELKLSRISYSVSSHPSHFQRLSCRDRFYRTTHWSKEIQEDLDTSASRELWNQRLHGTQKGKQDRASPHWEETSLLAWKSVVIRVPLTTEVGQKTTGDKGLSSRVNTQAVSDSSGRSQKWEIWTKVGFAISRDLWVLQSAGTASQMQILVPEIKVFKKKK